MLDYVLFAFENKTFNIFDNSHICSYSLMLWLVLLSVLDQCPQQVFQNKEVDMRPLKCQPTLTVASQEKNFFFSNSYMSETKWLRHKQWVLDWRFLRELNSKPIFEQVTASRSSGTSWVLKGPKSAGLNRVNTAHFQRNEMFRKKCSQATKPSKICM